LYSLFPLVFIYAHLTNEKKKIPLDKTHHLWIVFGRALLCFALCFVLSQIREALARMVSETEIETRTVEKAIELLSMNTTKSVNDLMEYFDVSNVLELAEMELFGQVTYWNTIDAEDTLMAVMHLNNLADHPDSDSDSDSDIDD
jgi:hypothetical protein